MVGEPKNLGKLARIGLQSGPGERRHQSTQTPIQVWRRRRDRRTGQALDQCTQALPHENRSDSGHRYHSDRGRHRASIRALRSP